MTGHGHASCLEVECCLTCSPLVECPRCHGAGETPRPGTYGPTVSPEALELIECYLCHGAAEVAPCRARMYVTVVRPEEP